ncbi:hypothetical protein, partial [Pseudomonas protegens]|uniref:hypothetical protein n=1 Tax=Pseudomonas protegens TaxID=380021 RepID=UPI00227DB02A
TTFFALMTLTLFLACFASSRFISRSFYFGRCCIAAEQAGNAFDQLAEETSFGRCSGNGRGCLLLCCNWRGLSRLGKALQQRL